MQNEMNVKTEECRLIRKLTLILFHLIVCMLLSTGCESLLTEFDETTNVAVSPEIQWYYDDNDIIIRISEIDYTLQYYAEITLVSGSKIAVQLKRSDANGQFRIPDNFGGCTGINIYTNLDIE